MIPEDYNPYAPPAADGAPPPPPRPAKRPAAPRVFGVLSITFSCLFLLLMGIAVAVGGLPTPMPSGTAPERTVERRDSIDPPPGALLCIGLDFVGGTISLLVVGIGQVRYRRWAARGTVIWSAVVIALFVVGGGWAAAVTPRAALELIPSAVVLLPYPVLLCIFFTRDRVVGSMTHGRWDRRRSR